MATIAQKLAAFDALDINRAAVSIIEAHPSQIIGYNQSNLQRGLYKHGDSLAPYRNKYYAAFKLKLNPLGVTDLRVTGDYYRSLKLKVDSTMFEIYSDSEKDARLNRLYGDDIKGISDEDKAEFANTVMQPGIVDYIRKQTGCI